MRGESINRLASKAYRHDLERLLKRAKQYGLLDGVAEDLIAGDHVARANQFYSSKPYQNFGYVDPTGDSLALRDLDSLTGTIVSLTRMGYGVVGMDDL